MKTICKTIPCNTGWAAEMKQGQIISLRNHHRGFRFLQTAPDRAFRPAAHHIYNMKLFISTGDVYNATTSI
jgi:hypothetical protein